jgi:ribosomal-protein-alanine N-acetyltransferase
MIAATPAFSAALAAIHAEAFAPGERAGECWSAAAFAALLAQPGVFGFISVAGGEGDGGLILARVAADEAEILTLGVSPAARRQGIGRALLHAAMTEAHARGAGTLFLEVNAANDAARILYQRCGFADAGQRGNYYGPGQHALIMRRALPCG